MSSTMTFEAFNALPEHAILSQDDMAALLDRVGDSISKAVDRGDLPPPIHFMNRNVWHCGTVRRFILEKAQTELESRRTLAQKTAVFGRR